MLISNDLINIISKSELLFKFFQIFKKWISKSEFKVKWIAFTDWDWFIVFQVNEAILMLVFKCFLRFVVYYLLMFSKNMQSINVRALVKAKTIFSNSPHHNTKYLIYWNFYSSTHICNRFVQIARSLPLHQNHFF